MGIYVKFWHFFTLPALQIWPCHVTQEENFVKILFFPDSAFNIGKSCKISSRKALYFKNYQPKTSRGGGVENTHPPVLLGLSYNNTPLSYEIFKLMKLKTLKDSNFFASWVSSFF